MGILFFENYGKGLCRVHGVWHHTNTLFTMIDIQDFSIITCFYSPFLFVVVVLCPMLPVSLNYPFVIAPSDYSNVY